MGISLLRPIRPRLAVCWKQRQRCYASQILQEQKSVQIGLQDKVLLTSSRQDHQSPILIFLPRGLDVSSEERHEAVLCRRAGATIVSIEYQLSNLHRFPRPIHQVLAGWDWILENLVSQSKPTPAIRDSQRFLDTLAVDQSMRKQRIGVCGELVGGSLAAMLALTECQWTMPNRVNAAILGNPITDWTALFPQGQSSYDNSLLDSKALQTRAIKPKKPKTPLPAGQIPDHSLLMEYRQLLFRRWPGFFDPLASPLLLFQSPSIEIPSPDMAEPWPAVNRLKRLYNRPYNTSSSKFILPQFDLLLGEDSPIKQQGLDLVKQLRRNERVDDDPAQKSQVACQIRPGHALWGLREIEEMGDMFGEYLRR